MCAAMIKAPTKAHIEAKNQRKAEKAIRGDINRIESVLENLNPDEMTKLHRDLDGKYQSCIADWGVSMYGYINDLGFAYDSLDPDSIKHNLLTMKSKLESFLHGWNAKKHCGNIKNPDINVTVNSMVNIEISFKEARMQVEDMLSLTEEQTKEALERISEIERIIKTNTSKKSKWEKIKPILIWLADKSYDLGKVILPLLLKIQE